MEKLLFLLLLLAPMLAQAGDVYIYRDDRGQPHYTDKPPPGAQKAKLPELQTYSSNPSAKPDPLSPSPGSYGSSGMPILPPEAAALGFYSALQVTTPTQNETLHSFSAQAAASVQPALQSAQGHHVVFYLDGMARPAPPGATSLQLEDMDRGTHNLSAAILGGDGQVLLQSDNVSFNVLPPSLLNKAKK